MGFASRKCLRLAERKGLIDKESIIAFNFTLALAILGITSIIGSSDMLAEFVVGVEFSWDGWFEEKTAETEFQAVIDSLFNWTFFLIIGASVPWDCFTAIGITRLIIYSGCILLLRRLPATFALAPLISQIKSAKEAVFTGWFGPMGVGALFYAWSVTLKGYNSEIANIVCFVVLTSIIVHGATVPLFHFERFNRTFSLLPENEDAALEALTVLITEDSDYRFELLHEEVPSNEPMNGDATLL